MIYWHGQKSNVAQHFMLDFKVDVLLGTSKKKERRTSVLGQRVFCLDFKDPLCIILGLNLIWVQLLFSPRLYLIGFELSCRGSVVLRNSLSNFLILLLLQGLRKSDRWAYVVLFVHASFHCHVSCLVAFCRSYIGTKKILRLSSSFYVWVRLFLWLFRCLRQLHGLQMA